MLRGSRDNNVLSTVPLLEVRNLRRDVADRNILSNISFTLNAGEILFVRGPSGVGKSLLLRALACLDHPQGGTLQLHGSPPAHVGFPAWRTAVSYVPQGRASSLRGTPAELYGNAQRFAAQRSRPRGDLPALVHELGLEQLVLNQQWGELSGGQAQRVSLALSVALGPLVLLLDEPTSACDPLSALRVEHVLRSAALRGTALVWVTHDPQQAPRVGGRILDLPLGTVVHLPPPPQPPPPLTALPLTAPGQLQMRPAADGAQVSGVGATAVDGLGSIAGGTKHSSLPAALGSGADVGPAAAAALLLPASRPAELLDDIDVTYGFADVSSPPSPVSPPSPSQRRPYASRAPRAAPP